MEVTLIPHKLVDEIELQKTYASAWEKQSTEWKRMYFAKKVKLKQANERIAEGVEIVSEKAREPVIWTGGMWYCQICREQWSNGSKKPHEHTIAHEKERIDKLDAWLKTTS